MNPGRAGRLFQWFPGSTFTDYKTVFLLARTLIIGGNFFQKLISMELWNKRA
jgi:hypothetical protein